MFFLGRITLKHNPGMGRHQSEIVTLSPAPRPVIGKICGIMEKVFFINSICIQFVWEWEWDGLVTVGLDGIARNSNAINMVSQ